MSPATPLGHATTAPMSTEHLRYEAILSLLYEHGLTLEEAGRVLDLNPMAVRRLYEGASEHLRSADPALTTSWRFLPGATHCSMVH